MLCFTIKTAVGGRDGRMCWTGGFGAVAGYARARLGRDRNGRRVQRSRKGKQCALYYWGMQLQILRRIGRKIQRSQKAKQLQISRRNGRRVQRSRKGKQCALYYWGMQLRIPRPIGRKIQRSQKAKQLQISRRIGRRGQRSRKGEGKRGDVNEMSCQLGSKSKAMWSRWLWRERR